MGYSNFSTISASDKFQGFLNVAWSLQSHDKTCYNTNTKIKFGSPVYTISKKKLRLLKLLSCVKPSNLVQKGEAMTTSSFDHHHSMTSSGQKLN